MDKDSAAPKLPEDPFRRVEFKLPVTAALVPAAREFARSVLERWGFPEQKCLDAATVVTELITNAVRAEYEEGVSDPLCVTLAKFDWGFVVLVEDAVPTMNTGHLVLPEEGSDRFGGFGLLVVDSLTSRSFWVLVGDHKVVGGEFRVVVPA